MHTHAANDLPVSLGYGNLLRSCCDPVPERLHEINLLVDREIVKPWRRSGDHLGNEEYPYEREYIANRKSRKADKHASIVAINGSRNLFQP